MRKIYAYQIAEGIDLKRFKREFAGNDFYSNVSESFYCQDNERYLLVLSYGVVVFLGYDEVGISNFISYIKSYCKDFFAENTWDEFVIHENAIEERFDYNEMSIMHSTPSILRIIMLNVGQSVTLDYYTKVAEKLLENSKVYTQQLEEKGKLNISNKSLMKVIGRTMNVKNGIVENLYIIDSPDETWEDEYLNKLDNGLKNTFDLKNRFKEIDYQLQIVKENLDLFKDLLLHRQSSIYEIIIIGLIVFEIIQVIAEQLFRALWH